MKKLLAASFALFSLICTGMIQYPPSELMENGKNAGFSGRSAIPGGREVYWKLKVIEEGKYSIRLSMSDTPANILYLNGRRLSFDSASPIKNGMCTAQTDFIELKNGDELQIIFPKGKEIGTLTLAKERLAFAPQKHIEFKAFQRDMRYTFDGTKFGETLELKLQNRSGNSQPVKLDVRIVDFFRIPVAEYHETIDPSGNSFWNFSFQRKKQNRNWSKTFDYRKGDSDQYRAIVKITDSEGKIYEDVFPYIRNMTGKYRSKIWLTDNWLRASVKDDFTRKTRTIQPQPPANVKWQKVRLPTNFPNHIAWFKRDFTIPENFAGKRWLLHFDRVMYEADIFVNGTKVHHVGLDVSMNPFDVDITDQIKRNGTNTIFIAVRGKIAALEDSELEKKNVNNQKRKIHGTRAQGISEIYLAGVPENRIGNVKITTSFRDKTIDVQAEIPKGFTVSHRVLHRGKEVLKIDGKTKWENPILWGPVEFPLLQLESTLMKDGKTVDVMNTRFGFREIWADGMDMMWNGHVFRCVSRPFVSIWGWMLGNPRSTTRKSMLDRIRACKTNGARMLRHNYDTEIFSELADEEGILLARGIMTISNPNQEMIENNTFWKHKMASDAANIRANINSPSIFTWYITNEMFAFSLKNYFGRVRDAIRSAAKEDPTRFVEAGCDLDLHGETKIISTHYPVEHQAFHENATYMPDMLYWRKLSEPFRKGMMVPCGQIKKVCNVHEDSPIEWGTKPIIVNETGWDIFYVPPLGYTRIMGDQPFLSWAYADFGHQLYMKLVFQGERDAGVSVIQPWRWYHLDDTEFLLTPLDLIVIQKYHTFTPGTKPMFDVNIFHDLLKKETLDFYWKLTKDGKTIQSGKEKITFDFCQTASRKIVPELKDCGKYELEIGLKGHIVRKLPLTVEDGEPFVPAPNMIRNGDLLNKEQLLSRAEKGETIIILPRKDYPAWLPGSPIPTERKASINFTFRPESPLLKGISERELSYWYPNHKTGSGYFVKPTAGNAKTIIEAGGPDGLKYAGLIAVPYGKGGFLYCALDLDTAKNPIAARLVRNMKAYRFPNDLTAAGLLAGTGTDFVKYLNKYGIATQPAEFGKLDRFRVLIVDGKMKWTPEQIEELRKFKGTVFIQNPGAAFKIRTVPVFQEDWKGRTIRVGYFPETAGLTNQELCFREMNLNTFKNPKFVIDKAGFGEIGKGSPMLYPVFLAKEGNFLYCTLNWMTEKSNLKKQGQQIISTLMTNLGVKIKTASRPELPKNLKYIPLDLKEYLDRTLADDVQNDGKGGWTDQGPDQDLREFKLFGLQTLGNITFRIEQPKACLLLKSRYCKAGYDTVTIPVNAKFQVLAWLHAHAWTSRQHHYSVFVHYADGSSYEIKMIGNRNLCDWASKPKKLTEEVDTLTESACAVPQKTFGQATLYRTAWVNPAPDKEVRSIEFRSMKRGIPVILAVSIGEKRKATVVTPEMEKQYTDLQKKAYDAQKQKKYQEAVKLYEQALELIPERLQPYRSIGSCWESLGNYAKAAEAYQKSLDADYNQPDLWDLLKSAKEKAGK